MHLPRDHSQATSSGVGDKPFVWRFAGCEIDERMRSLWLDGEKIELSHKPFDLLVLLVRHSGEVVTYEEILASVWPGRIVEPNIVKNTIRRLRVALHDDQRNLIQAIPKFGYRLGAAVERVISGRAAPSPPELSPGSIIPRRDGWKLVERLPAGAHGEVWRAEHAETQEVRVFKFALYDRQLIALKREIALHRVLVDSLGQREEFVRILNWNFEASPYFIESEFAGQNLKHWAEHPACLDALSLCQRVELVAKIADALAAAHSVGVLHKNLKPENILITRGRDGWIPKLADFGSGFQSDALRNSSVRIPRAEFSEAAAGDPYLGTLMYVAPELVAGIAASVKSDVYALGVILYQVILGKLGRPISPDWEYAIADPILREDILDATAGEPLRRLPSAETLAGRLRDIPARRAAAQARLERERLAIDTQRAVERARARRPWKLASGAALGLACIIGGFAYVDQHRQIQRVQAINDFLFRDLLQFNDPNVAGNKNVSLKDALANCVPKISARFRGDPVAESKVDGMLGAALDTLGDLPDASKLVQRQLELKTQLYGPNDRRVLASRISLELAYVELNQLDAARNELNEVMPTLRTKIDRGYIQGLLGTAALASAEKRYTDEQKTWQQMIEISEKHPRETGTDPQDLDEMKVYLIKSYLTSGDFRSTVNLADSWLPDVAARRGSNSPLAKTIRADREQAVASYAAVDGK